MTAERTYSRWALGSAALLAAGSMTILGALIYFAQPMGDDLCHRATAAAGVWSEIAHDYMLSKGRWGANVVHVLFAGPLDMIRHYGLALGVLALMRLAAVGAVMRAILPTASAAVQGAAAGGVTLLYWSAMPSLGDTLFWVTNAMELELGGTIALMGLAIVFGGPMTPVRASAAAVPLIFGAGLHELAAMAEVLVLLGACVVVFRRRSSDRWIWLGLLSIAAAAALVVFVAPGNFVRAERQGASMNPLRGLAFTGFSMGAWMPRWLLDAPLILGALLVWFDPHLQPRAEWRRPDVRYAVLSVWILLLTASFALPAFALNGVFVGRVLNWLYFLLLSGIFINILLWKPPAQAPLPFRSWLLTATCAAMMFTGNPWLGAVDLAFRIPTWSRARLAALESLDSAPKDRAATMPLLPPTPQMYFGFDTTADPEEYPNRCLASYFGVPSVSSANQSLGIRGAALSGRSYGLLNRPPR